MSIFVDMEKRLGQFHLRVRLEAGNEVLALLGASGCGKSTTLKCIAGVEHPDEGRITVDGRPLFDPQKRICLSPQKRRVGLLFQGASLFPHKTVEENIYAATLREGDGGRRRERTGALMERFALLPHARHYPHQLSGGQRQRTALARILASDPDVLLLDEPLSALDSHLRSQMEEALRQVIHSFGKTVLLVSHDREEVFRLADRIAIMEAGEIRQIGEKREVFSSPRTVGAARLTGCQNISAVQPGTGEHVLAADWGIPLRLPAPLGNCTALGVRTRDIRPGPGENGFRCRVAQVVENPFSVTLTLFPVGHPCTTPLGWEVERSLWETLKTPEVEIHIPPHAILCLKEK